jgi:hypothetical protein
MLRQSKKSVWNIRVWGRARPDQESFDAYAIFAAAQQQSFAQGDQTDWCISGGSPSLEIAIFRTSKSITLGVYHTRHFLVTLSRLE